MSRRAAGVALALLLAVTGCGSSSSGDGQPDAAPASRTADPDVLPAGSSDLALTPQRWYSPLDFVPPLAVAVPAGWHSAHRGDDAFDLTRPGLTVSFVTPDGDQVATSLTALRTAAAAAHATVTPVRGTLAGLPATGFDLVGGSGPLLRSPSGTVALAAAPGQRLRVLGTDVDQVPLLTAVAAPQGRWPGLLPQAQALLDGVSPG